MLEARARRPEGGVARRTLWIDEQTAQPLFVVDRTAAGRVTAVGILAHRYAADRDGAGVDAAGRPLRPFEPVAAAFHGPRTSWLRESFDARSLPHGEDELRRMLSESALERGR